MRRQLGAPIGFTPFPRPKRRIARSITTGAVRPLAVTALVMVTLLGPLSNTRAARPAAATVPINVTLSPSLNSPQPVGTSITWTASATDPLPLVYRFSVGGSASGPFTVQRDFGPKNSYAMAPLQEGTLFVQVTVQEGYAATASATRVASFTFNSRVSGRQPVISPTINPLVALYSAPACPVGGKMFVGFQQVGTSSWQYTYPEACVRNQSRNFLVAGMLPSTPYMMVNVVAGATVITSSALPFTTGSIPSIVTFPAVTVPVAPGPQADTSEGLVYHLLASTLTPNSANPFATNLQGQVVWYETQPDLSQLFPMRVQPVGGNVGTAVYLTGNDNQAPNVDNVLRATDLAGNPLAETNIQEVNAQLQARGQEQIYAFHHDALPLPNGDLAVLAYTEQSVPFTTSTYLGDMVIVLDKNLQVTWTWDAFNSLDVYRAPTTNDTCAGLPPLLCPVPGYPNVVDWTHSNALEWSASDNDIVVSIRDQDWVVKLNYANGSGDGSIVWRLGPGGDFRIKPLNPKDTYPWFSHQHDFNYINSNTFELFDNGNTRNIAAGCPPSPPSPQCDSRGQVYTINEQTKVVTQTLNVDLGNYSFALGVAQRLSNGNYSFTSGFQTASGPPFGQDIEELGDGSGTKAYVDQLGATEYRGWRMATLYSSINPPCPTCPS